MLSAVPKHSAVPQTYAELCCAVEAVVVAGRRGIDAAWVRTYHETGRLIAGHLLLHKDRADYGAKIFERLAGDTDISRRTLHECVQFYREFPIVRPVAQFGWNQCRLLCQVGDQEERAALIQTMKQEQLRTVDLKARVRALNATLRAGRESGPDVTSPAALPASAIKLLKPRRGTPDRYRVVPREEGPAVDVGFKLYRTLTAAEAGRLKSGMIVRWGNDVFVPDPEATTADLFTYRAKVRRVVDGDTLAVSVLLPDYEMDEKLRLRGLDCPEMDTPEGKAAKRFAEALLLDAVEVTITTSKFDKYDRYLADVHIRCPSGEEIFLNNALLQNGHAVPMGAEEMTEWTP
jgi:endonuclease YncB( thermonuclease family)